jgi:hypothetical protein
MEISARLPKSVDFEKFDIQNLQRRRSNFLRRIKFDIVVFRSVILLL